VVTPILFALLASAAGVTITADAIVRILTILLLPFVLGQIVQRWVRPWVLKHKDLTSWMDKTAIAIAVYVSFSGGVVAGTWFEVSAAQFAILSAALGVDAWRMVEFSSRGPENIIIFRRA